MRGKCSRCGKKPDQSSWLGKPSATMLALVGVGALAVFYFAIPAVLRSFRARHGSDLSQ
jgi:hypothetical protein